MQSSPQYSPAKVRQYLPSPFPIPAHRSFFQVSPYPVCSIPPQLSSIIFSNFRSAGRLNSLQKANNLLVPNEIIVPKSAVSSISRRLFLRNVSKHDMLIKLVGSNADVIQIQHEKIRLKLGVTLEIWVQINCQKMKSRSSYKIAGYATPYHPYNMKLNDWLNTPGAEKPRQLAFDLALRVCDEYSAQDIIIDMPGRASLIEPMDQSFPIIPELQSALSDTVTARDIDLESLTRLRVFASQERILAQLKAQQDKKGSCWLADYVSSQFLAPPPAAPKQEAVKEVESSLKAIRLEPTSVSNRSVGPSCATAVAEKPLSAYNNDEIKNEITCEGN